MESRECRREFSISDTLLETIRLVTNTHINPLGVVHGGNALRWMVTAASMTAMRVARGPALLAHMDNVFFINPIRLGMNAVITSWVEYIGRSSMELTVLVEEEDPASQERRITTAAHMTYVAVDEGLRPRPINACIKPHGRIEEELYERALERRSHRRRRKPLTRIEPLLPEYRLVNTALVNPEDIIAHNAMHAGRLLKILDETAGILAMKYSRGIAVTAAVDATDFVAPILLGDIIEIDSGITYIGRSSVEVSLTVRTYNPASDTQRLNATSHFTMVHLSPQGRPAPVPRPPVDLSNHPVAREAEERRRRRLKMLEFFKREASKIKPPRKVST